MMNIFSVADAMEILVTGYVADAGAAILYEKKKEDLLKRFSMCYLDTLPKRQERVKQEEEKIRKALSFSQNPEYPDMEICPDTCILRLGEGGIYKGLWDFTKGYSVGFRIVQKQIPIHQETIEVCNFFDLNPYALYSEGNLLIITGDKSLKERIIDLEVPATLVGKVTKEKKKVFLRGEEERFLERPSKEMELSRILSKLTA